MTARDSILIIFSNLLSQIINIIVFYFATDKYLPEYFGFVTIATSIFAFFNFFTDLSFGSIHIKKMAEEKENSNQYFTIYFLIKLILIPIVSLIIFIVIQYQISSQIIPNNPILIQLLEIFFISAIIGSLNRIYSSSFQSQLKVVKMQFPVILNHVIQGLIKLYAVFFTDSFIFYMLSVLIGQIVTFVIYFIKGRSFKLVRPNWQLFKEYLTSGSILVIPSLINIAIQNLGPFIFLNYYDDSLLGVYYVISKTIQIIFLLQTAFRQLFLPNFSNLISKKKLKPLREQVFMYEKYMAIIWGILVIGGFLCGPIFLKLYLGDFYLEYGLGFFLFSISVTFDWALSGAYGTILIASGEYMRYMITSIVSIICTIIGWIFFIPTFDLIGIKLGTVAAVLINIPYIRYFIFKKYGFGKITKELSIIFLIGLIFMPISNFIGQFYIDKTIVIFGFLIAFLLIYFSILFVLRILGKKDIAYFKDIFNLKEYWKYVKKGYLEDEKPNPSLEEIID